MARRKNKNNTFSRGEIKVSSGIVDNEYDLEKNLKKINAYSKNNQHKNRPHDFVTDSRNLDSNNSNSKYVEPPINSSVPQLTGDNFAWDSYTRLESRITDFDYKNDLAHTDLRKELESKIKESIKDCNESIEKRLPYLWYYLTIIGLVAIVGIWYMFSYIDVHPLPRQVQEIDKRLNVIEKKVDMMQSDTTLFNIR